MTTTTITIMTTTLMGMMNQRERKLRQERKLFPGNSRSLSPGANSRATLIFPLNFSNARCGPVRRRVADGRFWTTSAIRLFLMKCQLADQWKTKLTEYPAEGRIFKTEPILSGYLAFIEFDELLPCRGGSSYFQRRGSKRAVYPGTGAGLPGTGNTAA